MTENWLSTELQLLIELYYMCVCVQSVAEDLQLTS